jgi:hypothetical protein
MKVYFRNELHTVVLISDKNGFFDVWILQHKELQLSVNNQFQEVALIFDVHQPRWNSSFTKFSRRSAIAPIHNVHLEQTSLSIFLVWGISVFNQGAHAPLAAIKALPKISVESKHKGTANQTLSSRFYYM